MPPRRFERPTPALGSWFFIGSATRGACRPPQGFSRRGARAVAARANRTPVRARSDPMPSSGALMEKYSRSRPLAFSPEPRRQGQRAWQEETGRPVDLRGRGPGENSWPRSTVRARPLPAAPPVARSGAHPCCARRECGPPGRCGPPRRMVVPLTSRSGRSIMMRPSICSGDQCRSRINRAASSKRRGSANRGRAAAPPRPATALAVGGARPVAPHPARHIASACSYCLATRRPQQQRRKVEDRRP